MVETVWLVEYVGREDIFLQLDWNRRDCGVDSGMEDDEGRRGVESRVRQDLGGVGEKNTIQDHSIRFLGTLERVSVLVSWDFMSSLACPSHTFSDRWCWLLGSSYELSFSPAELTVVASLRSSYLCATS